MSGLLNRRARASHVRARTVCFLILCKRHYFNLAVGLEGEPERTWGACIPSVLTLTLAMP